MGDAPLYGLMLDAELLLYDNAGEDDRGTACTLDGPWSALLDRIKAQDASRSFPAARVSSTATTYSFGGMKRSGKDYDKVILRENARFAGGSGISSGTCTDRSAGCMEVKRMLDLCLYSWWTD